MTPTEHEGTVAVDAAARFAYQSGIDAGLAGPPWEELDRIQQNRWRERMLPFVWAALEALPDRAAAERQRIGTYTLAGDGVAWCHHVRCEVALGLDACTCGLDDLLDELSAVTPL